MKVESKYDDKNLILGLTLFSKIPDPPPDDRKPSNPVHYPPHQYHYPLSSIRDGLSSQVIASAQLRRIRPPNNESEQ